MSVVSDVTDISAGYRGSLMVESDGTVYACGYDNYGGFVIGPEFWLTTPDEIETVSNIQKVSASNYFYEALADDNTVYTWGKNNLGQLGDSRILYSISPIQSQTYLATLNFADSSYIVTIPGSGTNTVSVVATGTDEYGDPIGAGDIAYSLANTYIGVSVDEDTGVVTVTSDASEGSVQVVAAYGSHTCMATLNIESSGASISLSAAAGETYNICLTAAGVVDTSLLKAALLHDVGKSRCRIGVLYRTVWVLVVHILGRCPSLLARECTGGWRLPFWVLANHAEMGARLLEEAGSEERVSRLAELHQTDRRHLGNVPDREWLLRSLTLLQEADNEN
jgi:hypothetical protein